MHRRITSIVGVAIGTAAIVPLMASNASATTIFSYNWTDRTVTEIASPDFKPHRSSIHIGGSCGSLGGFADKFYVRLHKTSNKAKMFSSASYPCDGRSHQDGRWISVGSSTQYYIKIFGQDSHNHNGYHMPNPGVFASY